MSNETKKVVINVLPQDTEAWFCIAVAVAIMAMASCTARESEAGHPRGQPAEATAKP